MTITEEITTTLYKTEYYEGTVTETLTKTIGPYKRNRKCLPGLPFFGDDNEDEEDYDDESDEYYNVIYETVTTTDTETVTSTVTDSEVYMYKSLYRQALETGVPQLKGNNLKKLNAKSLPDEYRCDCSTFNRKLVSQNMASDVNKRYIEQATLGIASALIMSIIGFAVSSWFS